MCNRTTSTMTGGARRRPLRAGVIAGLVALFSIVIPVLAAADDSLPSRKQVLLLSASLWESYRWHIVAVVGLIGAQGVLIGALLLQHGRRRRAETVVRERLDFETLVSDLSASCPRPPQSIEKSSRPWASNRWWGFRSLRPGRPWACSP